jgi:uncharacterized membrane protein
MMRKFFIAYLATGVVYWFLDLVWLNFVMKDLFLRALGDLLLTTPRALPAIGFYLLYVIGIVVFAVLPALASNAWRKALGLGALLGLMCYATYDLSNLATLKQWRSSLAMVDICWGAVVTATSATAGFYISRFSRLRFG